MSDQDDYRKWPEVRDGWPYKHSAYRFQCQGCGFHGTAGEGGQRVFCPECLSLLREVIKRQREIREI